MNKKYNATIYINNEKPITMIVSGKDETEVSKILAGFFIKINKKKIEKIQIKLEEVEFINGNYVPIKNLLATIIKESRIKKGISQRELSRRSGVDNKTIAKIELGERKKPTIVTLLKISVILDLNIYEVLTVAGYSNEEIENSLIHSKNNILDNIFRD
ncbi:MAG: helix-turn-helix transcriptional regulator [Erysipelotrichaceae bacterium]|nr:helix-turn-helix transcriptional regulator [Erysipelotrichaceae bacterium]